MSEWKVIAAPNAPPLSGHSAVVHESAGVMFVFGGENAQYQLSNQIWSFTFASQSWQLVECKGDVPSAREGHSAVVYNNNMFVFGGNCGQQRSNELLSFNFENQEWQKIETKGDIPHARYRHTAMIVHLNNATTSIENKEIELNGVCMIVYGGWNSEQAYKGFHVYHFETNTWSTLQVKGSVERVWHTAALRSIDHNNNSSSSVDAKDAEIWIFAGEDKSMFLQNDLVKVTVSSKQWEKINSQGAVPLDRYGHTCVLYDDSLIVFFGFGGESHMHRDVLRYSFGKRVWRRLDFGREQAPSGRYGHSTVIHNGHVYVFGGKDESIALLNELYQYTPDTGDRWISQHNDDIAEPWSCQTCTFDSNEPHLTECSLCGSRRPRRASSSFLDSAAAAAAAAATNKNNNSNNEHEHEEEVISRWECSTCTLQNTYDVDECIVCQTKRDRIFDTDVLEDDEDEQQQQQQQ